MAEVKPVPDNYPRLVPSLAVGNAAAAIEFYGQVFGAVERARMEAPWAHRAIRGRWRRRSPGPLEPRVRISPTTSATWDECCRNRSHIRCWPARTRGSVPSPRPRLVRAWSAAASTASGRSSQSQVHF